MPEPGDKVIAVMFPLTIVRFTTVALPESASPLPIPEPPDEVLAVMFPLTIVRFTTVELPV
jgi:hypothetical protein